MNVAVVYASTLCLISHKAPSRRPESFAVRRRKVHFRVPFNNPSVSYDVGEPFCTQEGAMRHTDSCFWRRLPGKSQLKESDQMLWLEVISTSLRAGLASCIWPISLLPVPLPGIDSTVFRCLAVSSNNVHSHHFCLSFQRATSVFDDLLTNHFPSP